MITALVLLPACGGNETPLEACSDPVDATTVELSDFAFRPDCFFVDAEAPITLENVGDAPHTFTVAGTDVDVKVDPGASDEVLLRSVDPGTHSVTCTFHPQMEATFTIG
jgi:plastocyanin